MIQAVLKWKFSAVKLHLLQLLYLLRAYTHNGATFWFCASSLTRPSYLPHYRINWHPKENPHTILFKPLSVARTGFTATVEDGNIVHGHRPRKGQGHICICVRDCYLHLSMNYGCGRALLFCQQMSKRHR